MLQARNGDGPLIRHLLPAAMDHHCARHGRTTSWRAPTRPSLHSRASTPLPRPRRRSSVGKQSTDVVSASSVEREATIIAIANPPATAQRI